MAQKNNIYTVYLKFAQKKKRVFDTWKYFLGDLEPPTDWKEIEFYDANWPSGISGFGYGDGDDATIVPNITILLDSRGEMNKRLTVLYSQ